jgi:hypothetical protein
MASARAIIRSAYGSSTNFMTPTVVSVEKIGRTAAAEISRGEFLGDKIFGVSLAGSSTRRGSRRSGPEGIGASKMFHSLTTAKAYVARLKRIVKVRG